MTEFYVGIDLGGTNVRIMAASNSGKSILFYKKKAVERAIKAEEEFENNVVVFIEEVCSQIQKTMSFGGIGIAMAGLFNRQTGVIESWPNNAKWKGLKVREILEERFGVPVCLEDDANGAALGEWFAGKGSRYHDMAYITVSTGIGSGIISNDTLMLGSHGWAGELGHIRMENVTARCTCGATGCLQAAASGPAIHRNYIERKEKEEGVKEENCGMENIIMRAESGERLALDVLEEAGTYIGKAIANMAVLLDLPHFILGGGVMNAGLVILNPIMEAAFCSLEGKRTISIEVSELSDMNGVLGALAMADQYVNKRRTIHLLEEEIKNVCK